MASRRKLVLAGGIGVAGLLLIGLGVRASFTTSVTVNQSISTGTAGLGIVDAQWAGFNGESVGVPIEIGGAPFSPPGVTTLSLGDSPNNGSVIAEQFYITVQNTGTLPLDVNCTLAAGASDSATLAGDLNVLDLSATDSPPIDTLANVETNSDNVCSSAASVAVGATAVVEFEIQGNLGPADMGATVAPTLTVLGTAPSFICNTEPGTATCP